MPRNRNEKSSRRFRLLIGREVKASFGIFSFLFLFFFFLFATAETWRGVVCILIAAQLHCIGALNNLRLKCSQISHHRQHLQTFSYFSQARASSFVPFCLSSLLTDYLKERYNAVHSQFILDNLTLPFVISD